MTGSIRIPAIAFGPFYACHGLSDSISVYPLGQNPIVIVPPVESKTELRQAKPKEGPRLIKAAEAARFLSICPRTLWRLTNNGEVPCIRIGKSVRYDVKKLENWILALEE